MKATTTTIIALTLLTPLSAFSADGVHLVMLSGEKLALDLDESQTLIPALKEGLDGDIVVVKSAFQRKPIHHWYRDWKPPANARNADIDHSQGWIFHDLVEKIRATLGDRKVQTITLLWMQGESDAMGFEGVYADSFHGLLEQFYSEFARRDLNYVVVRVHGTEAPSKKYTGWDRMRALQVELGESSRRAAWVDTDDANATSRNKTNPIVGTRLAQAAIRLIRNNESEEAVAFPARTKLKEREPAHLFLLSGQSNMAGLDPDEAFTPAVNAAFGKEQTIVVKAAYGAKSISHWYKPSQQGETRNWLYRELVGKTKFRIADRTIKTVTLVWMQGESDADNGTATYADNFNGFLKNLRKDLGRDDLNFVIGRLSDHSRPEKYPEWGAMRKIQVELATSSPRGAWIDTDDLNGENNELHYPRGENGKIALGKRFAAKAIELASKSQRKRVHITTP